jgi:hypothetical protein
MDEILHTINLTTATSGESERRAASGEWKIRATSWSDELERRVGATSWSDERAKGPELPRTTLASPLVALCSRRASSLRSSLQLVALD